MSLGGFKFESTGLPSIQTFFAEGWVPVPVFETEPDSVENDETLSDLKAGFTLGPSTRPTPFDSLPFLDTLISYTTRSRTLGWITSQSTADKYTGLFGRAKSDIQAANVPSACTRLDTVLQQVPIDSAAALLTSEAYALLRFNTEYLDSKLAQITMVNYPANWSLLSVPRVTATFLGTDLFPTLVAGTLYGYNGGYYNVDTLQNGFGYWGKLSQATTITFTGTTLTQTSRTVPAAGWWFVGSISEPVPVINLTSNPPGLITLVYGYENGYVFATQLEPGKGYWVRTLGACTLTISK